MICVFISCNNEPRTINGDYCEKVNLLVKDGSFICTQIKDKVYSGGKGSNWKSLSFILYKFENEVKDFRELDNLTYQFKSVFFYENVDISFDGIFLKLRFSKDEKEKLEYYISLESVSLNQVEMNLENFENQFTEFIK